MADTTGTCARCNAELPIRLLRFRKVDGVYKYLCAACRSATKEAK